MPENGCNQLLRELAFAGDLRASADQHERLNNSRCQLKHRAAMSKPGDVALVTPISTQQKTLKMCVGTPAESDNKFSDSENLLFSMHRRLYAMSFLEIPTYHFNVLGPTDNWSITSTRDATGV